RHFVRAGLRSLFRPEPQTAVEWADANYYLPKESAYQEGRWETLPFQRAIMNAMGSDYIREVNVVKSARVGYPGWMPQKWTWIPRELPGGRASFIHVFEPVEDGQTRGANVFYSVMEQMKMLDTLQNTQLQSAIVKAIYVYHLTVVARIVRQLH
ncbi:phage portal protein, partial [Escherichia coli]|nr:phage portal protein [Escherichia coli]